MKLQEGCVKLVLPHTLMAEYLGISLEQLVALNDAGKVRQDWKDGFDNCSHKLIMSFLDKERKEG